MNPYETDKLLAEYLLFHYASPEQIIPEGMPEMARYADFPIRTVSQTLKADLLPKEARALDLGCAVGRSSFELGRSCSEVIGIDFSHRFIAAANAVKESGYAEFHRCEEGHLATAMRNFLPSGINRRHVRFEQGDALRLREDLGKFDVVHAANLIDRLPLPLKFLEQLPALIKPGGQLILTSPYTWLEDYTSPAQWLGGFYQNDLAVTTFDRLQRELSDFLLLETHDLPFLIREHSRKYQLSIAQATVWVRR